MGLEDLKAKILSYLEEVQVANRNDIADYTGASGRTLTKALNELVEDGSLEIIGERPLTYKFVKKNLIKIDFSKIDGYDQLKYEIARSLVDNGWLVSTHALAVISLMYAKFTRFRTLIFGSQGVGKTSTILSVFREVKEPIVIQDLHLKNLYEVVSSVKNNTKVIEEQYRHEWGKELLSRYDRYRVVPISRIGPAELLFRFIPIRILHPITSRMSRSFQQVYFEFLNYPQKLYDVDESLVSRFLDELSELKYFTIDVKALEEVINKIKANEAIYFTEDVSAEFYRINARYDTILSNDFSLVNFNKLHEMDSLYENMSDNLQIVSNALEILKFNYAWLQDDEKAIKSTIQFLKEAFNTFTIVKRINE